MKHLKYVLGTLLGLVLLGLFLWNTDLPRFWAAIRGADRRYLAAALVLSVASYLLRAIRWHYLVRPIKKASFPALFEAIVVGFTVSSLLPGRLGEVVRPYILAKRGGFKVSALFATVVVDRIFDAIAVVILLAGYLVTLDAGAASPEMRKYLSKLQLAGLSSVAVIVVVMAVLWLLRWRPEGTLRVARRLLRPLPARLGEKLVGALEHFAHGLSILADYKGMAWVLFWSLVVWVEIGLSHWFVIRAFGIPFPFVGSFLLLAIMVIGVSVPTPGGMGGVQWACKLGITLVATPLPDGPVVDAASMAVWGNAFVPVCALGLPYLWREGLSLGKIEALGETGDRAD